MEPDDADAAGLLHDFGRWYEIHRLLPSGAYVAYERPLSLRSAPVLGADAAELRRNLAARPGLDAADDDHDQTACPFFACGHAANRWWVLRGAPPEFHRTPVRILVCRRHFHILNRCWVQYDLPPADAPGKAAQLLAATVELPDAPPAELVGALHAILAQYRAVMRELLTYTENTGPDA